MTPFLCTHCGFWQRHFETPRACPICEDFRHTPPPDGYDFWPLETVQMCVETHTKIEGEILTFCTKPGIGIGTFGYLLLHPQGAIFWDGSAFYDDETLDFIASQAAKVGGLKWISASHPHAYGALWRLQERFPNAKIALPVADLGWTSAFAVNHPFEGELEIFEDLKIVQTGGHFDGHAVLNWGEKLFAGDLLKFHYDESRKLNGLSTHKAFNRQIPMSHGEIRGYKTALQNLDFSRVWTSFDCENCTRDDVFRLFDEQLKGAPFVTPIAFGGDSK